MAVAFLPLCFLYIGQRVIYPWRPSSAVAVLHERRTRGSSLHDFGHACGRGQLENSLKDGKSALGHDLRRPDVIRGPSRPEKVVTGTGSASVSVQNLLEDETRAVIRNAIEQALAGDDAALLQGVERLVPRHKQRQMQFELTPVQTARDAADAARAVLNAVAAGALSRTEGAAVISLLEGFRRATEKRDQVKPFQRSHDPKS